MDANTSLMTPVVVLSSPVVIVEELIVDAATVPPPPLKPGALRVEKFPIPADIVPVEIVEIF